MDQQLIQAVLEKTETIDDRKYLSCRDAFALAAQFDTKPMLIGKICNAQKIKLKNCQLGCF